MTPIRSLLARATRRLQPKNPPALILVYHRIATPPVDPLLLSVSPTHFEQQMIVLGRHVEPAHLAVLGSTANSRTTVAVTFDDGYEDNARVAEPVLRELGVPATVFVTSGAIGSRSGFWWDRLAAQLLLPGSMPSQLTFDLEDRELTVTLGDYSPDDFRRTMDWSVAITADPTPRHAAYRALFRALKPQRASVRNHVLDRLTDASGDGERSIGAATMSETQLRDVIRSGMIEIGAHTVTHPVLSRQPRDEQRWEIEASKEQLESILGQGIGSFAYPFGDYDDYDRASVDAVAGSGFRVACVNHPGGVWPRTHRYKLPRILVRDWSGEEFERRLLRWLRDPARP